MKKSELKKIIQEVIANPNKRYKIIPKGLGD